MSKKIIASLLAAALAVSALASCTSTEEETTAEDTTAEDTTAEDTAESEVETEPEAKEVTIAQLHTAIVDAYGGAVTMDDMGNITGAGQYAPNTLTVNTAAWDALVAADATYAEKYNADYVESENPDEWVPVNLYKLTDSEEDSYMYLIDPSLCELYFSESPSFMTQIDQLMIIKPAEGKTADVVAALNEYNEIQKMFQYPMNQAKAEAAVVYEKGDYVFFIRLGLLPEYGEPEGLTGNETDEELEAIFAQMEADRLALAEENNKAAIAVIDELLG